MEACRRCTSADLYTGTAFLCENLCCLSSPFAMDGYNFFNYVPTSDNEEGENDVVPSFFHNVVENIQNFDNEQEENAEYTVMEVIPHGLTGKVSFFICVFVIYKIHSDFQQM